MSEINLDLHQVLYQSLKDHDETIKRYIEMQLVKIPLQDIFDQMILTKINSLTESMIIQKITELNKDMIQRVIERRLYEIFKSYKKNEIQKKIESEVKAYIKSDKFRNNLIKTMFPKYSRYE